MQTDRYGRVAKSVSLNVEADYEPAAARAQEDKLALSTVVQTLCREYGAGRLSLGDPPASWPGGNRTQKFWLHPADELDAVQEAARRDGVTFAQAVRRLMRAYGEGRLKIVSAVTDRRTHEVVL